jgi:ElaB/YqjD/DUF883 family membrane-anchored ribosome-binding protein
MMVRSSGHQSTRRRALDTSTSRRHRGNDGGLQSAVQETWDSARETAKAAISDTQEAIRDKASEAQTAAEEYVGENPWKALAIAAAAGFVLALLIRR